MFIAKLLERVLAVDPSIGEIPLVMVGWSERPKSRTRVFAEALIKLTQAHKITWINLAKNVFVSSVEGCLICVTCDMGTFVAKIFKDGKEVFSLQNGVSLLPYTSESFQMPIMDLFDVVKTGERRCVSSPHWCGLSGFGQPGDTCPACEDRERVTKQKTL